MSLGIINIPHPVNEPVLAYAPGSPERRRLRAELARQAANPVEIPLVIGGREVRTGRIAPIAAPHDRAIALGRYHLGGRAEAEAAVEAARAAWPRWSRTSWQERAAIFLRAADLLAGPFRMVLNAATMLGQSKTVHQAEIDAGCELVDFWRFNPFFMQKIYEEQPLVSSTGTWNSVDYRPLEGFVFAITPFNFTAIAGNLPTSPAMMGNTVIWKPASTAVLSAHHILKVLEAAGLPDGVINLLPGSGAEIGDPILDSPDFAGLHFTGSTATFNGMWKRIGDNLARGRYRNYPRIVGETGGKDFVIAAPDADPAALAAALFRGAFEYQGQKCSAASRAYIPRSLWPAVRERMTAFAAEARMGDPADFRNLLGAVIDASAFRSISGYIEAARQSPDATIVFGGATDDAKGFFISPCLVETTDPNFRLMREEVFGPVLTAYVYEDARLDETLALVDATSPYALTGAIFARDRYTIGRMADALLYAAGNFYINDKPTGAVVGQQPFGGGRASGTNDKAGSLLNLLRWTSMRTVKENFVPPVEIDYPHMLPDAE